MSDLPTDVAEGSEAESSCSSRTVLLTGATGFVGAHLYPALVSAGFEVRCGSRNVAAARAKLPDRQWVELDVEKPATIEAALKGCEAAVYLIHGMSQRGDYAELEARSAENFATAAAAAKLKSIVYLGGVLPPRDKRISKHLQSRQRTGEILRAGAVSTIELRAAMIIGAGSASWMMVRDLAARLPAMLLPSWLRNHSHPVAIDDVVYALIHCLRERQEGREGSRIIEVPGPERLQHRDLLNRVAAVLGHNRLMINVPVLTPRLSSYWIALVTRVDLSLAKELVEGVRYDLDPVEEILWDSVDREPLGIEAAARLAISDGNSPEPPSREAVERSVKIGSLFVGDAR